MCSPIRKQFALVAWSENNGKGEGFVHFHKSVFLHQHQKSGTIISPGRKIEIIDCKKVPDSYFFKPW